MAKIMVADDTHSVRFLISSIFIEEGHDVIEAKNGHEALRTYFRVKPDLIITDYRMPDLDGYSLIQEIRKINPSAKCIICTGSTSSFQSNVQDIPIIYKPFNIERLMNVVHSILGKRSNPISPFE